MRPDGHRADRPVVVSTDRDGARSSLGDGEGLEASHRRLGEVFRRLMNASLDCGQWYRLRLVVSHGGSRSFLNAMTLRLVYNPPYRIQDEAAFQVGRRS